MKKNAKFKIGIGTITFPVYHHCISCSTYTTSKWFKSVSIANIIAFCIILLGGFTYIQQLHFKEKVGTPYGRLFEWSANFKSTEITSSFDRPTQARLKNWNRISTEMVTPIKITNIEVTSKSV